MKRYKPKTKQAGIYRFVITRPNKPPMFYVGQASVLGARGESHFVYLRKGKHHNIRMQRAFDKYGEAAFKFEILLVCELKKEKLSLYEQLILDSYPRKSLYNLCLECVDSVLGTKNRPETIEKKRQKAMGNKGRTGMPHKPESRELMSTANQIYIATQDQSWRHFAALGNKANTGKTFTPEHCAKIGLAHKDVSKSPEHCAKISATVKSLPPRARNAKGQFLPVT